MILILSWKNLARPGRRRTTSALFVGDRRTGRMADELPKGLTKCADDKVRCWYADSDLYRPYHDNEWGVPQSDDRVLYEKICLEGFQCGLSWATILKKRENFRNAFDRFDFHVVSEYTSADVQRIMGDASVVRSRPKIQSAINNAKRTIELIEEHGSLAGFIWQYEPSTESRPKKFDKDTLLKITKTKESEALSKALKKRGFSFIGPTTAHAMMQAMGMVNDHVEGCFCRNRCEQLRRDFVRPK